LAAPVASIPTAAIGVAGAHGLAGRPTASEGSAATAPAVDALAPPVAGASNGEHGGFAAGSHADGSLDVTAAAPPAVAGPVVAAAGGRLGLTLLRGVGLPGGDRLTAPQRAGHIAGPATAARRGVAADAVDAVAAHASGVGLAAGTPLAQPADARPTLVGREAVGVAQAVGEAGGAAAAVGPTAGGGAGHAGTLPIAHRRQAAAVVARGAGGWSAYGSGGREGTVALPVTGAVHATAGARVCLAELAWITGAGRGDLAHAWLRSRRARAAGPGARVRAADAVDAEAARALGASVARLTQPLLAAAPGGVAGRVRGTVPGRLAARGAAAVPANEGAAGDHRGRFAGPQAVAPARRDHVGLALAAPRPADRLGTVARAIPLTVALAVGATALGALIGAAVQGVGAPRGERAARALTTREGAGGAGLIASRVAAESSDAMAGGAVARQLAACARRVRSTGVGRVLAGVARAAVDRGRARQDHLDLVDGVLFGHHRGRSGGDDLAGGQPLNVTDQRPARHLVSQVDHHGLAGRERAGGCRRT